MSIRGPTRERLLSQCQGIPVTSRAKLRWYFNAARQLLLQGEVYNKDGDFHRAYVFLRRFLHLALNIPDHSDFNNNIFMEDRAWLKKERHRIFSVLEAISTRLDVADDRSARANLSASIASTAAAAAAVAAAAAGRTAIECPSEDSSPRGWWDALPELPSEGAAPLTYPVNPTFPALYSEEYGGTPSAPYGMTCFNHSSHLQGHLQGGVTPGWGMGFDGGVVPPGPPAGQYCGEVHGAQGPGFGGGGELGLSAGGVASAAGRRVEDLAVQDAFRRLSLDQGGPAISGHYPSFGVPEYQRERPSMRTAARDFALKRTVVLPSTLVSEFEKVARANTDRPPDGIETCGILAGKLSHNVLQMTTLIIPKQEGTSDSCATTDETELFNYMLANELITLGWIHTHPKQSCFMSSVDLHTHCGYQLMLPEAIAVVYAPCDDNKRIGVFRLTQPAGMKLIQECKLRGFHVHPDGITIYEQADLVWSPSPVSLVDLR